MLGFSPADLFSVNGNFAAAIDNCIRNVLETAPEAQCSLARASAWGERIPHGTPESRRDGVGLTD